MMGLSGQQKPLITILLLCYNHENFVAEALQGVLSQSYSPLEIIIFDDCSPDRTADIIERTVAEHPRRSDVRFVRNPRNMTAKIVGDMALSMANGEFIVMSCGDDIMLPNMVEEMANVWAGGAVSLVTANADYIDDNSRPLNRTFRDPSQPADDSLEALARDGANACCFGAAMGFERTIYQKFGWVPDSLKGYDLIYPFYSYLLQGARFIGTPLLKYRVHEGNASISLQAERATPLEKARIEQRAYLNHLAHAVLMEEILDKLRAEVPQRYGPLAERILPLLNIQMAEMSKKLVRSRRAHSESDLAL
jgi:glycosyltransferase involved in cell wall biosynthesis